MRGSLLLILVSFSVASAYELKTDGEGHAVHWAQMPVPYAMDIHGALDFDNATAEAIVQDSFEAWSGHQGSEVSLVYQGQVRGDAPGYDAARPDENHNSVFWLRDDWAHGADTLAITITVFQRGTGELLDADILVNERDYTWSDEGENDLQNTLTHEVGHLLGLGHSEHPEATMFATAGDFEITKRDLHEDDMAGLARVYPSADEAAPSVPKPPVNAIPLSAADRDDAVPAPAAEAQDGDEEAWAEAAPSVGCTVSLNATTSAPIWLLALIALVFKRRTL
ncbi:matrixin family metalloprotease [Myxococcota bacterium]|nr:matrixin family metalloprotease [Myxococcota bacterium]